MSTQLTGNAGQASAPIEIGEDQLSYKIRGVSWGSAGEVVLEETEDDVADPNVVPVWSVVPASQMTQDGGFNMKTGIKWMRVAISAGTGLDVFFDLKRIRTDGSITK